MGLMHQQMKINDVYPAKPIWPYVVFIIGIFYLTQLTLVTSIFYIVPHVVSPAKLEIIQIKSLNFFTSLFFEAALLFCLTLISVFRFYQTSQRIFNSNEYKRFMWLTCLLFLLSLLIKLTFTLPTNYADFIATASAAILATGAVSATDIEHIVPYFNIVYVVATVLIIVVWIMIAWLCLFSANYWVYRKSQKDKARADA